MDAATRTYAGGLARAFAGALLFAFPLLMTMEMWQLGGFSIERTRLFVFVVSTLPMLLGLSYYAGFEPTFCIKDEVLDALAAFAVGFGLSAVMLTVLGVLHKDLAAGEIMGRIAICAAPASIGALLATKQLGEARTMDRERGHVGYAGVLFLMSVGALFLAFNVAPTEEIMVLSYMMGPVHAVVLSLLSIGLMALFAFSLGLPGEAKRKAGDLLRVLIGCALPGYAIALLVSAYCLWMFGRLDGVAPHEAATMTLVLGFPAALGAATARLVI